MIVDIIEVCFFLKIEFNIRPDILAKVQEINIEHLHDFKLYFPFVKGGSSVFNLTFQLIELHKRHKEDHNHLYTIATKFK